jgi:hypothetical protein
MYLDPTKNLKVTRPPKGAHTQHTMSWSQRFMEKKEGGPAAGAGGGGEWKTVGRAAGGGGGGYSRSGGWTSRAAGGGGGSPKAEPKPVLNMDSEEQFPSLGGVKRPTVEAAKKQGFAALAASWAHQDAAEAAEQKRIRDEAQAAADKRAKEAAQYGLLESIMRRREENHYSGGGSYSAEECAAAYGNAYGQDLCSDAYGRHSPHSPTYDPEPEPEPEAEEEPRRGNPMFNYDEQEEGWATR